MLVIAGALGGAAWGAWLAKKRGGLKKDIAQYAFAFAIMWSVIGLIATIVIERMSAGG
ncbi:MAG: hypothetical protein QNI90_04635 [Dinoroseobacter sp.]|nr:hypothetical protein [Dinoroseobacter sp.]